MQTEVILGRLAIKNVHMHIYLCTDFTVYCYVINLPTRLEVLLINKGITII